LEASPLTFGKLPHYVQELQICSNRYMKWHCKEAGMKYSEETKPCPLCGTMLPYDKWLKVVGVYEAEQRYRKELESRLIRAKKQEQKLKKEYQKIRMKEKELKNRYAKKIQEEWKRIREVHANLKEKERTIKFECEQKFKTQQEKLRVKFEREKQRVLNQVRKEGMKIGSEKEKARTERLKVELKKIKQRHDLSIQKLKENFQKQEKMALKKLERQKQQELKEVRIKALRAGIEKQKARTEKVEKMAEKIRKDRDEAIERAKQLEEMIKKGTTPQLEGFDFERQLAVQLRSRFCEDEIRTTGKKGDIIHTVKAEDRRVGKIIYECKKTKEFQNKFIEQIRRDKARAIADYGVIVTWSTKEEKQNFWIEGDIIVVHPYGVLDIATFLRETLVQMYTFKLSKSEFEAKGKALLEFMQSEEFRTRIQDSIDKSRNAYEILKKEVKAHVNTWTKRFKIYESIYRNAGVIKNIVRYVLVHGKIPEKIPETRELPALPISVGKTETSNSK